ncbi:MAG: hypothetical protein IKH56_03010 [Oscillospiraceae bacterium]|nr:hypothetical protein [Oscillospiraceae bacterium]
MSDFRPENIEDPFSLESILAEYKGASFIDGDRRSSEDLLDARIDQIMAQSVQGTLGDELLMESPEERPGSAMETGGAAALPGLDDDGGSDRGQEGSAPLETAPDMPDQPAASDDADRGTHPEPAWETPNDSGPDVTEEYDGRGADVFDAAKQREERETRADASAAGSEPAEGFSFLSLFRKKRSSGAGSAVTDGEPEPDVISGAAEGADAGEDPGDERVETGTANAFDAAASPENPATAGPQGEVPEEKPGDGEPDSEILFFDDYRFAESDEGREFQTTWDETFYAEGQEQDEQTEAVDPLAGLKSLLRRFRRNRGDEENGEETEDGGSEPKVREDVFVPEPDYVQTAEGWARRRHGLMLRSRAALVLAFVMTLITVLFERGVYLPGINASGYVLTAVLAIMQLVVMALTVDLLMRGGEDLIHLQPGYETLLLLSSLVVLFCSFGVLARHDAAAGAPFCCVSAFAMALSLWGEYRQIAAMNLSLKTAAASEEPEIFVSDYVSEIECNLVKHYSGSADGFYNNLVETDVSESAYRTLAPIFVCLVILFSLIGSIGSGTSFSRCLAAVAAASASYSALSAFGVPFSLAARRLRRSGSAVAGWGGADIIYYADGVRICEHDLFPAGATITGIRIFDQKLAEKVIRYTGSLLSAAQSGLAGPFSDFMDRQGISRMRIDSYEICEGGFTTIVRNENILCGTASCLNLYGVSIPTELNLKNAMYVALDGRLAGVFTVAYRPTKNVQSALIAMLRARLKLFVCGRDFNISPLMVQQKLQIPVDDMEYLPFRQACTAAENTPEKVPHAAAVSVHSTPGTAAETVIGARRLRIVAGINTVISVVTSLLGMLIMLLFARLGAGGSVSPSSLCEYMLAMEIITILVSHVV